MTDWELAIKRFLEGWEYKGEFIGSILSGSYSVGRQSKGSDVDLMLVLSDETEYWQRGNVKIGDFLIEYLADPVYLWRKSFRDDFAAGRKVSVNMFAIGKIISDKKGIVAGLKREAEVIMKKPLKKMGKREIELAKYHLYDGISKLRILAPDGFGQYAPLYYSHLNKVLGAYASFERISVPNLAKMYKFLNDRSFREDYKLSGFVDSKFVDMVNACLKNSFSLEAIEELTEYVLRKMGGFEIEGWELRTKITSS